MDEESKNDAKKGSQGNQELSLELHKESPEVIQAVLFPRGTAFSHEEQEDLLDYYKLVAQNLDQISTKRQNLNSFFLSINSVIMAGIGVIVKEAFTLQHHHAVIGAGMFMVVLSVTGFIICRSWGALIRSSARMLQANLVIAQELEKHLLAAITTTQTKLHGTDFVGTARIEESISKAFITIYGLLVIGAIFMSYCMGFMPHGSGGVSGS